MDTLAHGRSKRRPPLAERLGKKLLARFNARRRIGTSFRRVPENLHKVANQLALGLELLEDFRAGRYRSIPWGSLAVLSGALLYSVSPADVLPDALLGIGALDDAIVLALATKLVRPQLEAYCVFKGYAAENYFSKRSQKPKAEKATHVSVEAADVPV